jgi:NAD-dependent deacetylase
MHPDERLVSLLAQARRILIFTGAGISTPGGIPDYRWPQGVWQRRQPVFYQDLLASKAARIEYWDFKLDRGVRWFSPVAGIAVCIPPGRAAAALPVLTY